MPTTPKTAEKTTETTAAATTTPSFEFFQGAVSTSLSTPRITVRRGGLMVISKAAVDLLGEDVDYVQLAYDRNTKAVGIRVADKSTRGCYRLRTQRKSPSHLVGGKRFFSYHEVDTAKATTYDVQDFGNGIIGFVMTDADSEAETTDSSKPAAKTTAKGRKSKAA